MDDTLNQTQPQAPVADPAATVPGAVPTPPVGGPVEPQAPVEPTNPVVENPVGGQTPPTGQNTPGGIGA